MTTGRIQQRSAGSAGQPPWKVEHKVEQAQNAIYEVFLAIAHNWQAEDILTLFRQTFFHNVDSSETNLAPAQQVLLSIGQVEHFHYTLNRVCYILINNWETTRQHDAIASLVEMLAEANELSGGVSTQLRKLRSHLTAFTTTKAFHQLELYASRYHRTPHWSHRYTAYLMASQYLDPDSPDEQRQAAKMVLNSLNGEFKRDLAIYTIRSEKRLPSDAPIENPTLLGDHILPLIKKILLKKGKFSCQNLANIFLAQSEDLKYKHFKKSLQEYLVFSMNPADKVAQTIRKYLLEFITDLYCHQNDCVVDEAIRMRTANKLIDGLTMTRSGKTSSIMQLLLGQGRSLTLV
ncbi:MAG: hypothetical protein AB4042_04975, partial [Leptolyngbyaceae cyanobacterium]